MDAFNYESNYRMIYKFRKYAFRVFVYQLCDPQDQRVIFTNH